MAQYAEGQKLKGSDGNIYVVQNGVPVRAGGGPSLVDPRLAPQTTKAVADAATAQATAPYAGPKAAADAAAANAQARLAEAQAAVAGAKTQTELETAKVNLAKTQAELQALQAGKGSALDALQTQVDRVGELYRQRLQGGVPNVVNRIIPDDLQPGIGAFDSAAQGLINPFMAAFRIPGVGSQSDTELRQFMEANTPSPNDSDAKIEEKLRNIQTRIDAERAARGQQAPQPQAVPGSVPPQGDQLSLATGKTRDEIDPALKATGARLGAMVAGGATREQAEKFLRDSGVDPANTNLGEVFQQRDSKEGKQWLRAHPGASWPIGPQFYTKSVPMSAARALGNAAATSAPGAFLASAANASTGGYLDNMTDNPEMARTGMQLLRQQHPLASAGGDVAGYALDEYLLGRIPGGQALMASRWGRRGADAAYGAFSGSGENDDNRLGGAFTGAAINTGGGMFGRGAQRAAGSALTGVKNASIGYLDNAGIPLTIGQIGNGTDSVVGKAIGGLEDRAAGLPIFDSIINSARRRGERGFNSAAFREAGGSGVTGAPGVQELHGKVNDAYSFLDPVTLPLDAQFAGRNAAVRSTLPTLPKYGPEISSNLNVIDRAAANGGLTGRDWQQSLRTVKGDKASLSGKEFSTGAIDTMDEVENNLLDLASRQAPQNLQGDLTKANQLNKQFRTITSALDNGPTQARGELFSPSRLDTASRASQKKFGGQVSSMEGNRPFYDLTQAGMDVMPNQVPDSGTAGRALLYSTLFGGGVGGSAGFLGADEGEGGQGGASGALKGLALSAALAAPYSKTGQKALQTLLLKDRPLVLQSIGEYLKKHTRGAGMFGASAARDYFYQPELPPQ